MNEAVNRVNVSILGDNYVIKGTVPAEHICQVNAYLNGKLDQMQCQNPRLSAKSVAVLTAFNFADELMRLRKDYDTLARLLDK
jgi:cell division protein ZapA